MTNAMSSAITAGVNGIAIALVDLTAFNAPTTKALAQRHPGRRLQRRRAKGNDRLAYIGQDLFVSGQQMGAHIAEPRAVG